MHQSYNYTTFFRSQNTNSIVLDHDGQDFTIKLQHKAKYTACKRLGEYLKEKAGERVFVNNTGIEKG